VATPLIIDGNRGCRIWDGDAPHVLAWRSRLVLLQSAGGAEAIDAAG
jgi:hypothetical protein